MSGPNETVINIKDGGGNPVQVIAYNVGPSGDVLLVPAHVNLDDLGNPLLTGINPGYTAQIEAVVAASFNRPNNATQYATAQLVANSTVAGQVNPMILPVGRVAGATARLARARLTKSSLTTLNAIFRAHFYKTVPVFAYGDGNPWSTNNALGYLGSMTFDYTNVTNAPAMAFTDGLKQFAVPDVGSSILLDPSLTSINVFAVLQVLAAYLPIANEKFTLALELIQN
jgi:hypothetical protein